MLFAILNLLPILVSPTDPEINMTTPQIIQRWNYPVEVHHTVTADGFILELHRIPYGRNGSRKQPRRVIFLQHGLLGSSADWVSDLPSQSAGFVFADADFDVWLGNMRGNTYCLSHTTFSSQVPNFWNWSWDEMSKYDIPALVNYVLQVTGQPHLYYVGHSQGCTTMFAYLSENSAFSRKIKTFYALAPTSSIRNSNGLAARIFRSFAQQTNPPEINMSVLSSSTLLTQLFVLFCGNNFCDGRCSQALSALAGPDEGNWNASRLAVYISHFPAGTSKLNMIHWGQMQSVVGVPKLDFGSSALNYQHYGQSTPPFYDFTAIICPIMLFYGGNDVLVNNTDVITWLIPALSETLKEAVYLPTFNHFDFIWGTDEVTYVYKRIINDTSLDQYKKSD